MNRCVHDLAVVILSEDRDAAQDRALECRCLPFEIMAVAMAGIVGKGELAGIWYGHGSLNLPLVPTGVACVVCIEEAP